MSNLDLLAPHLEVEDEAAIGQEVAITGSGFLKSTLIEVSVLGGGTLYGLEIMSDEIGGFSTVGEAKRATGTLRSNGTLVSVGNKVVIGDVEYTFKATVTEASPEGSVLIGDYASETLAHLKAAVNNEEVPGDMVYFIDENTTINPLVEAVDISVSDILFAARVPGILGNDIPTTTTATTLSWDAATLLGGANANEQKYLKFTPTHEGLWTVTATDGMNTVSTDVKVWKTT